MKKKKMEQRKSLEDWTEKSAIKVFELLSESVAVGAHPVAQQRTPSSGRQTRHHHYHHQNFNLYLLLYFIFFSVNYVMKKEKKINAIEK